jgi:hypothetical protein
MQYLNLQRTLLFFLITGYALPVLAEKISKMEIDVAQVPKKIVINEFLARNKNIVADEDNDDSDWIELLNLADQEIDIGGFYLTDNLNEPTKWQIPKPTIIPSKGVVLFWASGKDRESHTNFKLDKDGEDIGLFDESGAQLDAISFGFQSTDISYGRKANDPETWMFFQIPTPYQINHIKYLPGDINRSGKIDLADALLALQISTGKDNTQIGLNNIDINFDSQVGLEEAIFILKKLADFGLSQTDYQYEALFTHGLLHDIEIVISQQEWDGILSDMHEYIKTGNYRKATFIYKGPMGNDIIENVGFRVKGNISRIIPQDKNKQLHRAHFKVKFNETFDLQEGTAKYECRKNRRFCSLPALIFRLNISVPGRWDISQIKELFCYDILNQININTSRTGSSRLTITIGENQHYFGIYTLIEPINKTFLTRRYGKKENDGNLYKCLLGDSGPASLEVVDGIDGPLNATVIFNEKRVIGIKDWQSQYRPTYDLKTNENTPDHTRLLDFIHQLNTLDVKDLSDKGLKSYLDSHFGIDSFIKYMAMNMLLGKWDGYWTTGNNYYLYFNPNGTIDFIPCDFDSALAGAELFYYPSTGIYDWANHVNELISVLTGIHISYLNGIKKYSSPLIEKIFQIQAYRDMYENYIKQFVLSENPLFSLETFESKFNTLQSLYTPYLNNDIDEGEEMHIEEKMRNYFQLRISSIIQEIGR